MTEQELEKLESRIYAFSVDVFSFVKTLIDSGQANEHSKMLLNDSNKLYSEFLQTLDLERKPDNVIENCMHLANNCSDFLSKIEVTHSILNRKTDLIIESKEISRILKEGF